MSITAVYNVQNQKEEDWVHHLRKYNLLTTDPKNGLLSHCWDAKLLSCLSTAQLSGRTVPPILAGGQYLTTDLPNMFLDGSGPLTCI